MLQPTEIPGQGMKWYWKKWSFGKIHVKGEKDIWSRIFSTQKSSRHKRPVVLSNTACRMYTARPQCRFVQSHFTIVWRRCCRNLTLFVSIRLTYGKNSLYVFYQSQEPLRTLREDIVFSKSTVEDSIKIFLWLLMLGGMVKEGVGLWSWTISSGTYWYLWGRNVEAMQNFQVSSNCVWWSTRWIYF